MRGSRDVFNTRRDELNAVLAFCAMEVGDDGKIRRASRAASLDEALARANRLKAALTSRSVQLASMIHRKLDKARRCVANP
jgi:hypothetical protein